MAGRLFEETRAMLDRASLGVGGRVDEPPHPCQADGARAHGAGLERHIKRGAVEPFIAKPAGAGAQGQHFRMGRGIAELHNAVAGAGQHVAVGGDENGAHGHFAALGRLFGLLERQAQIGGILLFHRRKLTPKPFLSYGIVMPEKIEDSVAAIAGERVAKVMARAGLCSRRDAEKLIAEGRVALNGATIKSPALNVPPDALITVDGKPIPSAAPAKLWRYHKPQGLVTSHRDPEGRPTVFAQLPPSLPRAISVGRLDINSEGLLLLTNDGGLARQLELPAQGWVRRYRARLYGQVTQADLDRLAKGVTIDGVRYGPVTAELERSKGSIAWATISLQEGKNREVKRLMEFLGLKVARLIRVSFGPFHLGHLPEGAVEEIPGKVWREQLGIAKPPRKKPGA
jgi:23S rRNA pseudouridine2605 synthase